MQIRIQIYIFQFYTLLIYPPRYKKSNIYQLLTVLKGFGLLNWSLCENSYNCMCMSHDITLDVHVYRFLCAVWIFNCINSFKINDNGKIAFTCIKMSIEYHRYSSHVIKIQNIFRIFKKQDITMYCCTVYHSFSLFLLNV